nr:MAG TPA: hypothetical protein [Caudoviricetes sp.]
MCASLFYSAAWKYITIVIKCKILAKHQIFEKIRVILTKFNNNHSLYIELYNNHWLLSMHFLHNKICLFFV